MSVYTWGCICPILYMCTDGHLHTDGHTYILTDTPTYWQTHLHTDGLTYILMETPTYWLTHLCTDGHLHTDGHMSYMSHMIYLLCMIYTVTTYVCTYTYHIHIWRHIVCTHPICLIRVYMTDILCTRHTCTYYIVCTDDIYTYLLTDTPMYWRTPPYWRTHLYTDGDSHMYIYRYVYIHNVTCHVCRCLRQYVGVSVSI